MKAPNKPIKPTGFLAHPTLAIFPTGRPRGPVPQTPWDLPLWSRRHDQKRRHPEGCRPCRMAPPQRSGLPLRQASGQALSGAERVGSDRCPILCCGKDIIAENAGGQKAENPALRQAQGTVSLSNRGGLGAKPPRIRPYVWSRALQGQFLE